MSKVVSLGDEQKKRAPHCEYCGEEEHPQALMCPRIVSVIYHQDPKGNTEAVEIVFASDAGPPVAG